MDHCEIRTSKVPGGIGSSAWEASVEITNGGFTARAAGRGETRQDAKTSLGLSLHALLRDVGAIYAELAGPPK